MLIDGRAMRTIWPLGPEGDVAIIDQTKLPHVLEIVHLRDVMTAAKAIKDMWVRGAPLIGATAAYAMALAMRQDASDGHLQAAQAMLAATRPTAVNLNWALEQMRAYLFPLPVSARVGAAYIRAAEIADEDVALNSAIGDHGLKLLQGIAAKKRGERLNILTHCNAGWLATVDWGTATSPIYKAHAAGLDVHVYVDETRPRNQGAALTAYELGHHGVSHEVIVDNAGGHLMQHGLVDICIVGTDRTTARGDVCNKIGTYLKALAARDNDVPFYVAAPSPSIDFSLDDGLRDIPIEEREASEVTHVWGREETGTVLRVQVTPEGSPARNPAFDVTPARLVTGLITERGIIAAKAEALAASFPERV